MVTGGGSKIFWRGLTSKLLKDIIYNYGVATHNVQHTVSISGKIIVIVEQ